jgi:hypothetical protein
VPGDVKMSNIANQLIAVVATLLGFVAHDALSGRNAPQTAVVASAAEIVIDPVVTRSIDLDGLRAEWLSGAPRAERVPQLRPAARASSATAATRPDPRHADIEFADVRINQVRVAAPGMQAGAFIR